MEVFFSFAGFIKAVGVFFSFSFFLLVSVFHFVLVRVDDIPAAAARCMSVFFLSLELCSVCKFRFPFSVLF